MSGKLDLEDYAKLTGVQKSAILLMAIEEDFSTKVFSMMDDEEIREISQTMSTLGHVKSDIVERLSMDFLESMSDSGVVVGNYDTTEKLLMRALGKERGGALMEELRGPAGRTTWDKLANVSEEVLASYLKNEYPQTIALVLTKVKPDHVARVLSVLPEDLSMEVITRMLTIESVKKEVLDAVEKTLKSEFMTNLGKTQRGDTYEHMAEIFNNFDRQTESMFMGHLEERDSESAEKIRALMFTFEDLLQIDAVGIQTLLRATDKDKLATALKGASEKLKGLFFENMSERAAKIMKEDMETMGPIRLKDVDEAQLAIVNLAKELAAKGEIVISEGGEEDQLIY